MVRVVSCPSCLSRSFVPLIDFGDVPRSGTYLSQPDETFKIIHLAFEYCTKCALIRRKTFNADGYNYIDVERTTGHLLTNYVHNIIQILVNRGYEKNDLIIEVGSNDGTLLDYLSKAGYENLLGIEPSIKCAAICSSKGHRVENVHLDKTQATRIRDIYGLARVIFCRHTLEHVSDPIHFLLAIKAVMSKDGILVLEVPDSRSIIHDLQGHELWDEHLHYFNSDNLQMLLGKAGFKVFVKRVEPFLTTNNILFFCNRDEKEPNGKYFSCYSRIELELSEKFASSWGLFCKELRCKSNFWPKPIVAIGASHPQSNFLIFSGMGRLIDYLVDDDKKKEGRYVPLPNPVVVVSTSGLLEMDKRVTIVRTAFGYDNWMNHICISMADKGALVVDPYEYV